MAAHSHGHVTLAGIDPELLTNPTAVLATNGPDGHPQLTAVWYVIEDDQLCISVTESTRKARNLAANDRCAVLIFHSETPNYYVEIRGVASIEPDHEYVFADRLGARYETDMRSFDPVGARRLRVSIRASRITITDVRAGSHELRPRPGVRRTFR